MSGAGILTYCAKLAGFGERQTRRASRPGSLAVVVAISIIAYFGLEVALRIGGLGSFPVYVQDPVVGYYLVPNQHGLFLQKNHWFVNSDGFANDRNFTDSHPSSLLVGDSIVYGGDPVDYDCRVGTLAGEFSKQATWVAAAGGWNLLNELAFLEQHQRILRKVDRLIFVLNNGDFDAAGQWTGEFSFPTRHPLFLIPYLARRYLLPHPAELPPVAIAATGHGRTWQPEFDRLVDAYPFRITVILYPDRTDYADKALWERHTAEIRRYAGARKDIRVIDLRDRKSWRRSYYRDEIHPTCAGNHALAEIVAAEELR